MKKIFKNIFVVLMAISFAGCDSYFNSDPSDIINSDDYIGATSEMYSGYLGIISKMQAAGDQMIFMSDIRADFLEPTSDAPEDLWQMYYYNNSSTNEFADPVDIYAIIIACNDYMEKMFAYREKIGDAMDSSTETNYKALISGAIRIKAWTYFKLAQLYGEAIYFDDPVTELKDVTDGTTFVRLNSVDEIVDKCLDLIDNGVNGIDGTLEMNWGDWLDPENPTDGQYQHWNYITPDWLCLRCELLVNKNEGWAWIKEQILSRLVETFYEDPYRYSLNAGWTNNYYRIFAEGTYYSRSSVSSIIYDYTNNQTNDLITYFGHRAPAQYLIRPTTYAMSKYSDSDRRGRYCNFLSQDGDTVVGKYHANYRWRQPYQSDASIPLYRGHDYHFWLAEAENHLGKYEPAGTLLNEGVAGRFPDQGEFDRNNDPDQWDGRYRDFLLHRSYNNIGIEGCVNGDFFVLSDPTAEDYNLTEEERIKEYDLALLDAMLLEYPAEGRVMGMMYRMATRYNDMSIIADRVVPKYPVAMQDEIRSKIMNGDFFIKWDL
ncbi:RagB/SusD family nutrient uptake outer membrane protein [Mangrovibacterium lignilyticum]|uniref:RagB/SusD family nutrient uptake outer membrane protein n=1 Tax=Mangrovibacterium lignilyticum TaxID=2668052 RepID=UPI0013D31D61|nr:RagB/SusD family nutrient uptake outer membrane protein [Mangrovibacterium lignilyticum]